MLDWQPKVSLREGLTRTIEYFDRLYTKRPGPALRLAAATVSR
jgi:hypothetical protein